MFLRRISRRKFNPRTPMAAVVFRTGTKAQSEFSTEKLHIKNKYFNTSLGRGDQEEHFVIVFVAAGLPSVTWEKVAKRGHFS
jgi:hypothetical protein